MRNNLEVVLAHIERYYSKQKPAVWDMLLNSGIRMQCNSEFFLNRITRRKALRLLRQGKVHFIGSDCHNMSNRAPMIGEAYDVIHRALGDDGNSRLEAEAKSLFVSLEVV